MSDSASRIPSTAPPRPQHHVVIIGGGFGGLAAARALAKADVRITLIDRRNHHLFQPLLYQVATGGLSAAEIAMPIRKILRSQENVTVLLAEARRVDVASRRVVLDEGALDYDSLVIATGASHAYFGHEEWAALAPGLKSIEDAFEMRRRVFFAFEAAERTDDEVARRAWLTFVVVGAGATGVELAGTLAEIARRTLVDDFRRIETNKAHVILVEGMGRVLGAFPPDLSEDARQQLVELGVDVWLDKRVEDITPQGVQIGETFVPAKTVLWAAGVRGSSLGRTLGTPLRKNGQVEVLPDLSIPGHPEVFVIGDLAYLEIDGKPAPGLAQNAIQGGQAVAETIEGALTGQPSRPYRYRDLGIMATIGRSAAVAQIGKLKLTGFLAWLAWVFVHIMTLVGFRNRVITAITWVWAYFTFQRGGRLILETPANTEQRLLRGQSWPRTGSPGEGSGPPGKSDV